MGIDRKILAAFLFVTLLVGVAGYIGIVHLQQELTTKISADSTRLASTLIDDIDKNIYSRIEQLKVYAEVKALKEEIQHSNSEFQEIKNRKSYINTIDRDWKEGKDTSVIREILSNQLSTELLDFMKAMNMGYDYLLISEAYVTNKYGVVVGASGRTSDYLQADEDWYQQTIKEQNFWVGEAEYDESSATFASDIVINLYDSSGQYIGIFKAVLNIADPIRIIQESERSDTHTSRQTKLLTRTGHMIYSTDHENPMQLAPPGILSLLHPLRLNSEFISAPGDMPGEGEEIFAGSFSRGYRDYKGVGWTLIVEHDKDEVLSSVSVLKKEVFGMLSFVLVLGVFLSVFIARSISKPLVMLSNAVSLLGKGEWNTHVEIKSKDEVGSLSKAFNQMVEELRGSTVSKAYFDNIINNTPNSLVVVTPDGYIELVNQATATLLGYTEQELLGEPVSFIFTKGSDKEAWPLRGVNIVDRIQQQEVEEICLAKDGSRIPVCLSGSVMLDAGGEIQAVVLAVLDLRARKKVEKQLETLAHYDSLTQLPNRILFMERIQHALEHAQRNSEPVALMFLDLDRFKNINDSLGHDAGDQLLQKVADRLRDCVRQDDTVSRLAGDEFTIILEGDSDAQSAAIVAQNILQAFEQPFSISQVKHHISTSIGISLFPHDGNDTQTLIKCADAAMYFAKAQGRNNYQFFTPELTAAVTERFSIENEMREALERDEFVVYYQPQLSLLDNQIVGVEALVRWQHPEKGMLSPGAFLPVAEESGLICAIGEQVLRKACVQAKAWQNSELPPIMMSVNLAGQQILFQNIKEQVETILRESGLDPKHLELEITEGFFIGTDERVINTLNGLKSLGVTLSIDDFGTGYSSLSYLKRLPVDKIKIDQSFVRDLDWDNSDESIVRAIIAMGNSLSLRVIAEGVETEAQKEFLKEAGCGEYQGYLFSKPVPAAQIASLLEKQLLAVKRPQVVSA